MPSLAGGGAERVMLTLAEDFVAQGLLIDLVLTRKEGSYIKDLPAGVRVVDLKARRIIYALPALTRYIREARPTAMLSAMSATNCIAAWAKLLARVDMKLVLSEHSTLSQAWAHATSKRAKLLPLIMAISYRLANSIIGVSKGVADDLATTIKLDRSNIHVIHNPIFTPAIVKRSAEPVDHPWFAEGQPPVILGVGRLVRAKDFPTLVKAFGEVRSNRNARLVILGEGPERGNIERVAHELELASEVQLLGFVENPYSYMRKGALLVLSSRWEGFANVLVEAMACGTPVVSTDCPSGPREILDDGKWGGLVPLGDATALAHAITNALDTEPCGFEQRARDFSVRSASLQYLALLLGKLHA